MVAEDQVKSSCQSEVVRLTWPLCEEKKRARMEGFTRRWHSPWKVDSSIDRHVPSVDLRSRKHCNLFVAWAWWLSRPQKCFRWTHRSGFVTLAERFFQWHILLCPCRNVLSVKHEQNFCSCCRSTNSVKTFTGNVIFLLSMYDTMNTHIWSAKCTLVPPALFENVEFCFCHVLI